MEMTTCQHCGKRWMARQGAKYCGSRCRTAAHREAQRTKAKRHRQQTIVRTDTTESQIAFYRAKGDSGAAAVLVAFAHKVGIPIREREIERREANYRESFAE